MGSPGVCVFFGDRCTGMPRGWIWVVGGVARGCAFVGPGCWPSRGGDPFIPRGEGNRGLLTPRGWWNRDLLTPRGVKALRGGPRTFSNSPVKPGHTMLTDHIIGFSAQPFPTPSSATGWLGFANPCNTNCIGRWRGGQPAHRFTFRFVSCATFVQDGRTDGPDEQDRTDGKQI